MRTTTSPTTSTTQSEGIVVYSDVKAGGWSNHAEGIVVHTAIEAGGTSLQHAEGIVARSDVTAGGSFQSHAEGIVDPDAAPTTVAPADQDALVIEF